MKLSAIVFSLIAGSSLAYADASKLSDNDTALVAHLHSVDTAEVMAGKLAETNGTKAGKSYGDKLVKDHNSFEGKLMAFAKKHNLAVIPDDSMQTAADKKAMDDEMTKLKGLTGADFDKELGTAMAAGHDKELDKANAAKADDKDLQSLINGLKPTLKSHADAARKLSK